MQAHSLVPHSHNKGEKSIIEEQLPEWLTFLKGFTEYDLGDGHLEEYRVDEHTSFSAEFCSEITNSPALLTPSLAENISVKDSKVSVFQLIIPPLLPTSSPQLRGPPQYL